MLSRIKTLQAALLTTGVLGTLGTPIASADTRAVFMQFSDPGNVREAQVILQFEDTAKQDGDPRKYRYVIATIPPDTNARQKRDIILSRLQFNGFTARTSGDRGLILSNIDSKVKVHFDNGGTMEHDVITCQAPVAGEINFRGVFEPHTPDGQPAIFSAGIITDHGQASCSVSAADLNFQTDGPTICASLCQLLAPQAQQLGAQVGLVGDQILVRFDPQSVIDTGGVTWGTDSPSEGCGGALALGFPNLWLDFDQLVAGQITIFQVQGAQPNQPVGFLWGLNTGNAFIPQLGFEIDLALPRLLDVVPADPLGNAALPILVPPSIAGLELHFQAVASEALSQVKSGVVERR